MHLARYLFDRIPEYEKLIYALGSKYRTAQGEWGELSPIEDMKGIRKIFVSRTRAAYRTMRRYAQRPMNIEIAYREVRELLRHPVAKELEGLSETPLFKDERPVQWGKIMINHPKHIVNGFQFNDDNARLFAYALDVIRLGGELDAQFWTDRIVGDDDDLLNIGTTGPIIRSRSISIFDSVDRNREDAAVVCDALLKGFWNITNDLQKAFITDDGESPVPTSMSRTAIQYLIRPMENGDMVVSHPYRQHTALAVDKEPVLLAVRSTNSAQYLWNGRWRALASESSEVRQRHFNEWYFGHLITIHRLRHMASNYLCITYPETFGG